MNKTPKSEPLSAENATIEVLAGRIEGRSVTCLRVADSYVILDDVQEVRLLAEELQRKAQRMDGDG